MSIHHHKGIKTLKDVFPEIKKEYRRNFLLENKIKIKDIEKVIQTKKEIEREKSEDIKIKKQKLRSGSSLKKINIKSLTELDTAGKRAKSNQSESVRTNHCICGLKIGSPPASAKSTTSIDKEVQTDFNLDENYRYINSSQEAISGPNNNHKTAINNVDQTNNHDTDENQKHMTLISPSNFQRNMISSDQRIESLANPLVYKDKIDYLNPYHEDVQRSSNLNVQFDKLKLDDEISMKSFDEKKKKSASSAISTSSSRYHSEIKLPKYLEKMKREKELQKTLEMEKDENCPNGFIILDEKIRLENLEILQRGFQSLVDELNRLPMNSVTLRVKNRKNEIERELNDLESKIRYYEKSKIYIKCSTDT